MRSIVQMSPRCKIHQTRQSRFFFSECSGQGQSLERSGINLMFESSAGCSNVAPGKYAYSRTSTKRNKTSQDSLLVPSVFKSKCTLLSEQVCIPGTVIAYPIPYSTWYTHHHLITVVIAANHCNDPNGRNWALSAKNLAKIASFVKSICRKCVGAFMTS